MSFKKDFLWGGAIAANQAEGAYNVGGKGLSVADMKTVGGKKRNVILHLCLMRRYIIPHIVRLIFIIITKKILLCLRKWALKYSD